MESTLNKNNIWFFGDSYTDSAGLDKYAEVFNQKVDSWNTHVSNQLNMTPIVCAMGGASVTWIINKLISNLSNFKKNDIIIISDSFINRLDGYDMRSDSINTLDNESLFWNEEPDYSYETHLVRIPDESNQKIVNNYVYSFINEYYNKWEIHYKNQIENIAKLLITNNIELYFWSHRLYNFEKYPKYTRLTDESNLKINDAHWGPNGHLEFSKYILTRIEKKEYFPS